MSLGDDAVLQEKEDLVLPQDQVNPKRRHGFFLGVDCVRLAINSITEPARRKPAGSWLRGSD
jgi:hypothetical protein